MDKLVKLLNEFEKEKAISEGWCVDEDDEYFLWIWYWKKLSDCWLSSTYTTFKYKEEAEMLIEKYKNGEIKEIKNNVVWYY